MRNPYLRTLIPLALICSGTEAAPVLQNDGSLTPVVTPRDAAPVGHCPGQSGPGIMLGNKGSKDQTFTFWKNKKNGVGWADPEFDNPDPAVPAVTIPAGKTQYVKIASDWKGRVQRGKIGNYPATWAEFQLQDTSSGTGDAWGDISLIQGCDGAVTVASTDGSGTSSGFTRDCMAGAPDTAIVKRPDGTSTIGRLVDMWPPLTKTAAAIPWLKEVVPDEKDAYQLGPDGVHAAENGTDVIASKNNCLAFDFY